MKELRIDVEIHARADQVWAVMIDVERWPEWNAAVRSVELLNGGPLKWGSRARIKQPGLPDAVWQVTTFDGFDAGKRVFSWMNRRPGVDVTGSHQVEALGTESRVTLTLRFSGILGPFVARLLNRLNRRYTTMEAMGLKERCERRPGPA
jgi:uncharacterized membrane protein